MKTKIGLPFGLALVMFIGVFTAMLALGVLSPQPAEAAFAAPDLKIEATDYATYARADWTFTVKNDNDTIDTNAGNDVVIVFPIGFDLTDDSVTASANWSVKITGAGGTSEAEMERVGKIVSLGEVTVTSPEVGTVSTLTVMLIDDPVTTGEVDTVNDGETVEIKFTAPKAASGFPTGGIINPIVATPDVNITVAAFEVFADTTTDRIDVVGEPANVVVNNNPDGPGHEGAAYRIDFYASTDLTANLDSILVRFDKDIGDPPSISRTAVLITAAMVTPDDGQ